MPSPSVRPFVRWSVGFSILLSSKSMKNELLRILNDLDSAGGGRRRDKEEGGTRRDEEERGMRRVKKNEKVVKKMKNKKVASGRIVDPCGLV